MSSHHPGSFSGSRPPIPPLTHGETLEQHDIMISGKPYIAMDPLLSRLRDIAAEQLAAVNGENNMDKRMAILNGVCDMRGGKGKEEVLVAAPFTVEYVSNRFFSAQSSLADSAIW